MFNEKVTRAYMILAQKCQAGVKVILEGIPEVGLPPIDPDLASAKNVRVGINNLFVEQSMLIKLLIEKGIITWDEIGAALIVAYEAEKERLEAEILQKTGIRVTLDAPPGYPDA